MSDTASNDLPPQLEDDAPPVIEDVPPIEGRTSTFPIWIAGVLCVVLVATFLSAPKLLSRNGARSADQGTASPPNSEQALVAPVEDSPPAPDPRQIEIQRAKQVATGIMIYLADYDDMFPHQIEDLDLLDPYLKNRQLTQSQLDGSEFALNRRLACYSASAVKDPSTEPLVIGPVWPTGERVVAFVDGSARWVQTSPELDGLRYAAPYRDEITPVATNAESTGELTSEIVNGQSMLVPAGWKATHTPDNGSGIESYRWEGPQDEAYIKVDINRSSRTTSLEDSVLKLEQGFKNSSRYRYRRTNWRTGKQAFKNGVIWNFEISRDGAPMHKRGIVYFNHKGVDYAILVSRRADSERSYSELFTKIWTHAGRW